MRDRTPFPHGVDFRRDLINGWWPEVPAATEAPAGAAGAGDNASAGGDVLVPIIAALAFVLIGLGWFLRRRGAA